MITPSTPEGPVQFAQAAVLTKTLKSMIHTALRNPPSPGDKQKRIRAARCYDYEVIPITRVSHKGLKTR